MRLDPPSGDILGELVERAAGARPFRDPADQETLHILEDLEARPSDLPLVATPALVQVRCVFLNRARKVVDSAALEGGGPDDWRRPAVSGLQLELQVRDEHVLVPEVDLVHDVDVADLEDPGLHRLHDIPGEGHFHDDRGVRTTRNLHLALPRAGRPGHPDDRRAARVREGPRARLDRFRLIVLDQGNERPRGPLVPFQKRDNEASDGVARTFRRNGAHAPLSACSKNETMTLSGVPGPKTALTPARFSFGTSSSGMIPPPTTTMSPDFRFFRRRSSQTPNTSRITSQTSPSVAFARTASRMNGIVLSSDSHALRRRSRARACFFASLVRRSFWRRSTSALNEASVTRSGSTSVCSSTTKSFTPTIVRSLSSTSR